MEDSLLYLCFAFSVISMLILAAYDLGFIKNSTNKLWRIISYIFALFFSIICGVHLCICLIELYFFP